MSTPKKPGKPAKQRPLTVRQQKFAEFVASGKTGTEAWLQVYPGVSRDTARANAAESLAKPSVAAYVAELRKPQTEVCLMTLDAKRRILAEIVRTPIGHLGPESPLCAEYVRLKVSGGARGKVKRGQSPGGNEVDDTEVWQIRVKGYDKLRAIELDSKLAGHFAPAEVVVESGPSQLESIRERAKNVVSALDRSAELRRNRVPIDLGSRDSTVNSGSPTNNNGEQPRPVGLSRWPLG